MIQLDVLCGHIRKKTSRKWGPILTCLRRLKKSLKREDGDDDDDDDDGDNDVSVDGEYAMDSPDYEDVTPGMLRALEK